MTLVEANDMNSEDKILRLLRDRILELIPFGLNKLWFRMVGSDYYDLAIVLGYSSEFLSDLILYSPLSHRNGNLGINYWSAKLKLKISINDYFNRQNFKNERWILFKGPIEETLPRRGQMKIATPSIEKWEIVDPYSFKHKEYIDDFFDNLESKRGIIRDRRVSPDVIQLLKDRKNARELEEMIASTSVTSARIK